MFIVSVADCSAQWSKIRVSWCSLIALNVFAATEEKLQTSWIGFMRIQRQPDQKLKIFVEDVSENTEKMCSN